MGEPLKDKIYYHNVKNAEGKTNQQYPHHYDEDIKSAVEWLKEKIWGTFEDKDNVAFITKMKCKQIIDQAFPDLNTNNSKNTIKDDRECKICGKKLSEHSSFSDNHTHISKGVKE